jgi:hypothetical protein
MFTWNFLRLNARPPEKGPPRSNFVDLFFDPETGKIHAKNAADAEVLFNASGGAVSTGDLTTEPGNGSAAAGGLGEYKTTLVELGDAFVMSSATPGVIALALTAGDWDVEGVFSFDENAATVTARTACIHTSASLVADGTEVYNHRSTTTTSTKTSLVVARKRISLAADGTVYLVGQISYSAGAVDGFGSVSARRVR